MSSKPKSECQTFQIFILFASCRYDDLLFESNEYAEEDSNAALPDDVSRGKRHKNKITELNIYVASNDQSLDLQTDESYVLEIEAPTSSLSVRQKLKLSLIIFLSMNLTVPTSCISHVT